MDEKNNVEVEVKKTEFITVTAAPCMKIGSIQSGVKRVSMKLNTDHVAAIIGQDVKLLDDIVLKIGDQYYTNFKLTKKKVSVLGQDK